ncbi:MAG TPA: 4-(cytidine 5'-diphospho)-2-C-methyl-D-erythritol kinase [Chitinispirillaceae bacterium]|nr:4-(cytidine 5'-diphospho)-2-C-methyl-D-erythritol kinase [Chitinispirillaceae bacterium]
MEIKSCTRVTLALDIIKKITSGTLSGYHELSIIKHQIDLYDLISVKDSDTMSLSCNVETVPCNPENICWKAAVLLKEAYDVDKNIHSDIYKNIPVMGGLAGGSANAAATIQLLNTYWELGLSTDTMMSFGRKLGMDVPFYFLGKTAFDSEATAVLYSISTSAQFSFILAVPEFGVSTKSAYSSIDYHTVGRKTHETEMLIGCLKNDHKKVYQYLHNDFENNVFRDYPRLSVIKNELLDAGCAAAMLSGSGSTILGVVENDCQIEDIAQKISCRTIIAHTLNS